MACDLLAVGAHPDDVELFCGGTVATLVGRGVRVGLLDLSRGELGTRGTAASRRREAERAAEILGVAFRETLDLGDGALRHGPEEEAIVASVIRRHRPRLILAPPRQARHPDHARAGALVEAASYSAGLAKFRAKGKPHRPDRVVFAMERYLFLPTFVVDVTRGWAMKMEAIRAFESQFHREGKPQGRATFISRPEFLEEIEARGRFFGSLVGVRWGEPFLSDLPPRLDDPLAAFSGLEG
jgi:bacillithiol biosynthesis deacetylase BshB1